jgi:hypothetical protein
MLISRTSFVSATTVYQVFLVLSIIIHLLIINDVYIEHKGNVRSRYTNRLGILDGLDSGLFGAYTFGRIQNQGLNLDSSGIVLRPSDWQVR